MGFSNDDGCGHDAATLASSATTASESSITPMSIVGKILQDAEHDLDNSEWPGMMGTVLHPVRDTFWLPPLRFFNQHIAPIATSALPSTIDHAVGAVVGVTSGAIRFTYGILPHIPSLSEFAVQEIETTSLLTFNRLPSRDSVSDAISQLFSLFGFVLNSILDLLTNPAQKYSAFLNTIKMFAAFLMRTGITTELSNAIATRNAVTNMMLVARIQGSLDDSRRADVAFRTPPFTPKEEMHLLQESKRHLQYATAAYGTFQISASDSLPQDHQQQQKAAGIIDDAMDQLQKKFRRRIAKYLGLAEEDILYMTSPGEELSVIPHFVAIEKATKSLILALRGTNSLTGVFTDIDATTIEFCGGVAHKGMADLAINLLQNQKTMQIIDNALTDHDDFRLILIGHSLGAGVASLVCMKVHYDGHEFYNSWVRHDREVRCIGFGCPPVFGAPVCSPCMKGMVGFQRIKTALSKIVCFINRHDVVPFLSVDSIRRLVHMLDRVDALTQSMNPIELALIVRGMKAPPREMVQIVEDGSKALPQVGGAERLKIPGLFVLWMDDAPNDETSNGAEWNMGNSIVVCCRPSDLSNLAIRFSDQFIADHMPPRYEVRIQDILS